MKKLHILISLLLLLCHSGTPRAYRYSEASHPLSLYEEELLSQLIQESLEARQQFPEQVEEAGESVPDQENAPVNSGGKAKEKKGQREYVTFVQTVDDPAVAARKIDGQEIKRRVAEEGKGGRAVSLTEFGNVVFLSVAAVCSIFAIVGVVTGGVYWHRLHKQHLAAQEAEYPHYGVIGPAKEKKGKRQNGDESMAYKAQLHHYQQTKQKIIGGEDGPVSGTRQHESDDSEHEEEDGDYSVYECPGLAPTGDIEVQNPMFNTSGTAGDKSVAEGN